MGLVVQVVKLEPLVDALSLFRPIAKNVELRFSPLMFALIASSPRFVATLQIDCSCFPTYIVDNKQATEVLLSSFYDALFHNAEVSTTMTMILIQGLQKIALRFHEPSDINLPPSIHQLRQFPSKGEDLGVMEDRNYFGLLSSELRRIIRKLPLFQHHSVCVTVTSSQVMFSVGSKKIVVTKKIGFCQIEGFAVETQLQVVFLPMLFFINLTYRTEWIWFNKKLNSDCLIFIPMDGNRAEYVIHFPQM